MFIRNKSRLAYLATVLLFAAASSRAADSLYFNQSISNGGFIQSAGGRYSLVMQKDGNLIMYRADGSIRYRMPGNGAAAVMQGDGNFVEYTRDGIPLWYTGTGTGLRNHLTIQDDGDLVVFSPGPSVRVLWSLGTDSVFGDPKNVGDVIGRDLASTGAGLLGHLGIWDGKEVFNVGPPTNGNNAVHIDSLFDFKHILTNTGTVATYWGASTFKIPPGTIHMTGCWETSCPIAGSIATADARYSIALRLMQIYRIGADYTITAYYQRSLPPWGNRYPGQRGLYRCDTFVIDALRQSTYYHYPTSEQSTWINRWNNLNDDAKTPSFVFDKLKSFQ